MSLAELLYYVCALVFENFTRAQYGGSCDYVCTYMCICMHTHTSECICMYENMFSYILIHVYNRHVHTDACKHTRHKKYTYMCMFTDTCAHTRFVKLSIEDAAYTTIHTYTYIHTYTRTLSQTRQC